MTPLVLAFPAIEPEIFRLGPFALRWYALAYIAGIVIGWRLALRLADTRPRVATRADIDDKVTWVTLGIIRGGRLGLVGWVVAGRRDLGGRDDLGGRPDVVNEHQPARMIL